MPFAIAILQIARNRAPPVRGKGLSHLSFGEFSVSASLLPVTADAG